MYRYADAFRCSRRNFLCFEESCRDLTQRPVRVDEKCLWREFSVFPYDGINTPDTVSQQYPELTKLCLRYFAQDKNTDSFRKQQAVPRFSASGGSSSRICVSYIAARFSNFSRGPIFGLYILIDRK